MTEKYNVYLDDCRETPEEFQVRAYTYKDIIQILVKMEGYIGILSLDNDLGEEHEGYDVMKWIEKEYYINDYKLPDKIIVHSMNPIAKKRMEMVIDKLYGDNNDN